MATILNDVLTVDWLKAQYLAGVDWTDQFGVALPDSILVEALRMGIRRAEADFDICILPVEVHHEQHDMHVEDIAAMIPISVRRKPLLNKPTIMMSLGSLDLYELPQSWVVVDRPKYGRFHILPLQYEPINNQAQLIIPALRTYALGQYVPGGWKLDYQAGFLVLSANVVFGIGETTKTVTFAEQLRDSDYNLSFSLVNPNIADAGITPAESLVGTLGFTIELDDAPIAPLTVKWVLNNIPADLASYVGLRAAVPALNTAGATLVAPGVASKSTSVDGLSQSVTSTQNAQTLAYGNRVAAYEALAEQLRISVAARWRSPNMRCI